MKRLITFVLAMTMVVSVLKAEDGIQASVSTGYLNLRDCNVLRIFARLWKDHALGETENGAWIVSNGNGQYQQIDWPFTPQRHSTSWAGVLPDNIIAQMHTHGENLDPTPSKPDSLIAKRLKICVYTVTRKGIWRVSPEGTNSRELDRSWFQDSLRYCGKD